MSSAIIHPYMDANPESEQFIFNNFAGFFEGNSLFGHSKGASHFLSGHANGDNPVLTALSLTPCFSGVFIRQHTSRTASAVLPHPKPLKRLKPASFSPHPAKAGC
jgi:hypothetical protein